MRRRNSVVKAIDKIANPKRIVFPARMGTGEDYAYINTGTSNRIWVTYEGSGIKAQVWNLRLPTKPGLRVLVGEDPDEYPGLLQILRERLPPGGAPTVPLTDHHERHELFGDDEMRVYGGQVMPLNAVPIKDTFTVVLQSAVVLTGSVWTNVPKQNVLLVAPASGARWGLIQIPSTGVATVKYSPTVTSKGLLTYAGIPLPDANCYPTWAVQLYGGQEMIRRDSTFSDLYDLRWANGWLGGAGGAVLPVNPSVVNNLVSFADIVGGQADSGVAAADVITTGNADWIDLTDAGETTLHSHAAPDARELLTGNRAYYVRKDGSDGNDGLTDNAGGAFLTVQHAVDVIAQTLDINGYTANITVHAGTYSQVILRNVVGYQAAGNLLIIGFAAETIVLQGSDSPGIQADGLSSVWSFDNLTLVGDNYGLAISNGTTVIIGGITFSNCSPGAIGAFSGSTVRIGSVCWCGAMDTDYFIEAQESLILLIGGLTFTDDASFIAFIYATNASFISVTTFASDLGGHTVTGKRFLVDKNSYIDSGGGGINLFPGDAPGEADIDSGGIYDTSPVDAANVTYTPTTAADWDGSADPGNVDDALDQLAERVTDVEGGAGHDAVTLDADAGTLLSLSTQEIGLDVQAANTVLAGRVDVGAAEAPTFRALVAADIPAHDQDASTIIIPDGLGTPAYDDVQDFLNLTRSAGRLTGGAVSKGTGATISITAMEGMIFTGSTLGTSPLIYFKMPAQTDILGTGAAPNLIDNSVNWIYIDYAAGTPVYKATTDRTTINDYTMFTVARAWVSGATVEVQASGHSLYNKDRRSHNRLILKYGGMDRLSGATLSQHATALRLQTDAGSWYIANTPYTTALADKFTVMYRTGGGAWTESAELTLFSEVFDGGTSKVYEKYQNGTSLGTLSGSKYGVYWVFINPLGKLIIVLGTSDYANVGAAQAATVPASLPARCTNWSRLIGRVICQKTGAAFYSVESTWATSFTLSAAVDHASLASLAYADSGHTGFVPATRTITATAPITIEGTTSADLSADRTIAVNAASTTGAGVAPQATAPAAGLYNYVGITNGETAYSNKALFDAAVPTTIAPSDAATAGTAAVAARRDHLHAAPATFPPTAHNLFSTSHGDIAAAASPVDGDIIIGNVTPKWSKLAISVPAASLINVLGVVNGETRPSWKALLDATNPANIGTAAPGTATTAAHRDHVHAIPANGVTLAMLATQAADTVLANATAGAAVPTALALAEQTVLGRITGGRVVGLTAAQILTLLGIVDSSYTPTITGITNVAANTPQTCYYTRIGASVRVYGGVAIDPTAAGAVVFTVSLPVASDFTVARQCVGKVGRAGQNDEVGNIDADTVNNAAQVSYLAVVTANHNVVFSFDYVIA